MHVVVRQGSHEREVVVDQRSGRAVVGDLLAAVGLTAEGVDVDGRWFPSEMGLDEAPIPDGAVLTPSPHHPPAPVVPDAAERRLTVVAGRDVGRTLALTSGSSVRVGRDADNDLVLTCPTVSGRHLVVDVAADGVVTIEDARSHNGTWANGQEVRGPTPLPVGGTVRVGAVVLRLDGARPDDRPAGIDRWLEPGNIPFNRPPRAALPPDTPPVTGPGRPDTEQRGQPLRVAAILAPIVMGGVMVAITGNIRFALFIMMSPVIAISTWVSSRRQAKKGNVHASAEFVEALARLDEDLARTRRAEHDRREALTQDLAEVVRRATAPSIRLWERRLDHEDLLLLRLGSGPVPWDVPLELPDDDPDPEVAARRDSHAVLHDAAVQVDLANGGVVGIVGARAPGLALARSLVCQAAVHHGPADLPMTLLVRPDAAAEWDFAKWLPHTLSGTQRLVSADRETSTAIAASLESAARAADDRRGRGIGAVAVGGKGQPTGPVRLYVVDDLHLLSGRRAPTRTLLRSGAGPAAGIVLAPTEDQLPASCTVVVEMLDDLGTAEVRRPAEAFRQTDVVTAGLSVDDARTCARALARFEDPELAVVGGSVPTLVRLLPLLGLDGADADGVLALWSRNLPDPGAAGPIGVSEDGSVELDLRDDGPHGLVGGTTGSGKSELLRSMVAGMAARTDPDHLVFVLVDYKGGSAFDECAGLPHTVGMVTDLDEHLGERALLSLNAELHHRERLFRDAGVTDLPEYLRAGSTLGPCPRMVVVIDEFATMAAELPDFLDALVGIAQRGRSLGVHLILATQRPRGAVNANIKANTNLRIALRVQDPGDSADIIDTKDAAELRREHPGRAWIRRGHGDLTLVQSALSTGPALAEESAPVAVGGFGFRPVSAPPPPPTPDEDAPTDLGLLVAACREAFDRGGYAEPRKPWLPMPSTELSLDEVTDATRPAPGVVPFGIADDPAAQSQVGVGWDLAQGHLAVFGMVGSGTTTTLQTIASSVARHHHPDDLHLYGVDFGGGGLRDVAALPHCGAVVAAADREEQFRLFRFLSDEVDRRRGLTAEERGAEPHVVVLLDDVAAFLGEHQGLEGQELVDQFKKVFAEGPGAGVSMAVTGNRPAALPLRLGAGVNQKLMLRHADPSDFGQIGVREKQLPSFVPGRAVLGTTKQVVQVALPDDLRARAADLPTPSRSPAGVGALPSELAAEDLAPSLVGPPIELTIGIDDATLSAARLVLHPGDHVTIAGPSRSGKSSLLCLLSAQIRALLPDAVQLALTDPSRSPLHDWPSLDGCGSYEALHKYLVAGATQPGRWFVLVDDAPAVEDKDRALEQLVRARPDLHIIAAGRPSELKGAYGHWTRALRQSRTGVLLQPDLATDGDLFNLRLPRRLPTPLVPGRGFLLTDNHPHLTHVALPPINPPKGSLTT